MSQPTPKLARAILRVRSPATLAEFYRTHLGMTVRTEGEAVILGYGGQDAELELRPTEGAPYRHERSDRYWKIGITLPNVDLAAEQLAASGIAVSQPKQFRDIGYLCHLADPEGFVIELLQHGFAANRPARAGDPGKLLGGGAAIGQITLRTLDIEAALQVYQERLNMHLLSVQPLEDLGFTLYFLAFTAETPPDPDLEAVGNREWLWRRPYTTLELQHLHDATPLTLTSEPDAGFAGLALSGLALDGPLRDEIGQEIHLAP